MEKFFDATQLWFWFIRMMKIHQESLLRNRVGYGAGRYKMQLVDVQLVITQLEQQNKLTPKMIEVLAKYSKRHTEPNKNIQSQQQDRVVWDAAMAVLGAEFVRRGWTEKA